jgi:glutamate formiminotransferase
LRTGAASKGSEAQVSLIAVPNVSEGRDETRIQALVRAVADNDARVLDVHSDVDHNRSVFTVTGAGAGMETALRRLATVAARSIDLETHSGAHPRLGCLDVCPYVPLDETMEAAVTAARRTAEAIGADGLPVYLYGAAAARAESRELPALRRGGLSGLITRAERGLVPDFGPHVITRRSGVVCVGARGTLIAFNAWLRCDLKRARAIAASVRESNGGLTGVRAIGVPVEVPGISQVSMNLTRPAVTGIDAAFEAVSDEARRANIAVTSTEIVGLVPARFMPDPQREAARMLMKPGRSLEAVLGR